jgi:hypothetical protein
LFTLVIVDDEFDSFCGLNDFFSVLVNRPIRSVGFKDSGDGRSFFIEYISSMSEEDITFELVRSDPDRRSTKEVSESKSMSL